MTLRSLYDRVYWLQLLCHPVEALDLTDPAGKPDHGKILPAVLLVCAIVAQFAGTPFPATALIVLGSLAYGYGAWRSFLKAKAVTGTEQATVGWSRQETRQEVDERRVHRLEHVVVPARDPELGVQPTVE